MSLDDDLASHLHSQIVLDSGRRVTLESLDQRLTYLGWLEGVPSQFWNDDIIASCLQKAESRGMKGARPTLINPIRRDFHHEPGDMEGLCSLKRNVPEWLPMVTCIGVLSSMAPARDSNQDGSNLVVVWFQDEYAFPIEKSVFEQIKSIDWDELATDFDF